MAGGYNGSISGGDHCIDQGCYVIEHHCVRTVHAEMNALLQCSKYGISTNGADMYVSHFPCLPCTKSIIQAGISRLYYAKDYKNSDYAITLLKQAQVQVVHVPFDERKIDFLSDEKVKLYLELLQRLRESGAQPEELASYEAKVKELFGV